jgi:hypothetical protein
MTLSAVSKVNRDSPHFRASDRAPSDGTEKMGTVPIYRER